MPAIGLLMGSREMAGEQVTAAAVPSPREGATVSDITRWASSRVQVECPAVSPSDCFEWAELENFRWAERFGLVDSEAAAVKIRRTRCGLLSGLAYPQGSPELVLAGANLFTWLFLFDDRYGEGGDDGSNY